MPFSPKDIDFAPNPQLVSLCKFINIYLLLNYICYEIYILHICFSDSRWKGAQMMKYNVAIQFLGRGIPEERMRPSLRGARKKQSSSWNSCGAWPAVPAIRSRILDLVQIWTKPGELYRKGPEINTQCVLLWIRGFLAWTPQIKAPFMKALCKFVCLYVW